MFNRRSLMSLSAVSFLAACFGGGDGPRRPRIPHYNGPAITQVQVFKKKRKMLLISGNDVVKKYDIALGVNPVGHKRFEGDGRTPEGAYKIDYRKGNSAYHLSLHISYPNEEDTARAEAMGKEPGGAIFIHGREGKHRGRGKDWTVGCIAVTDDEIEEIWSMVKDDTTIFIFP